MVGPTNRKPRRFVLAIAIDSAVVAGTSAYEVGAGAAGGANDQQQIAERLVERQQGAGVADRRIDLEPVADDAGIAEEARHVGVVEGRNNGRVEARERLAEVLTLAQDDGRREPRLERLERIRSNSSRSPAASRPHSVSW